MRFCALLVVNKTTHCDQAVDGKKPKHCHTYGCNSFRGAHISQAKLVCDQREDPSSYSFTTATQLKHKDNSVLQLLYVTGYLFMLHNLPGDFFT